MVCPKCCSMFVKKDGKRALKGVGITQTYKCNSCNRKFSVPIREMDHEKKNINPGKVFRFESDNITRLSESYDILLINP